jgi:OB-fold nucleic acid binding domain.
MKMLMALLTVLAMGMTAVRADESVIDATDLTALRAKAGTNVAVEGRVTEIGTTQDGGITFINVGMPRKQGFVAVIFRDHYQAFPDGFDKYREKKVRVSGVLTLYRGETPQIKLTSPEQIAIVE